MEGGLAAESLIGEGCHEHAREPPLRLARAANCGRCFFTSYQKAVDKLEEYARVHQLTSKPEGYHFELADVVVRMADLWGWVGGEMPANIHPAAVHIGPWEMLREPLFNCYTRDESLSNVHIALAVITEAVRVKNARPFHERVDLRHVIRACVSAASV